MSDKKKRSKLSGAAFRKLAKEKRDREAKVLTTLGRVDTFFTRNVAGSGSSSSCTDNTEAVVEEVNPNANETVIQDEKQKVSEFEIHKEKPNVESDVTKSTGNKNTNNLVSDDPAEWCINESTIDILLHRGINQNCNSDFSNSRKLIAGKTRYLNKNVFYRNLLNGESTLRDYLVYSCRCRLKSHGISDVPIEMSKFLRKEGLQTMFPNVDIALRIFLCTPITNCSAERSFSALKRLKSYLRSNLSEKRLNALSILHIEGDLLTDDCLNYEDMINEFATAKARWKLL